ncbi:QueT transporter family protein [Levilactobacillus bambusae]|uniref:QueT transporter family protein n=2 Tax=Levilactobacillus bambusae TaxID=2024736 RepID=A0A2V1N0L9_9LACO|nr:QueT transporter family protein [Levilactobacillus bambusae]
MVKAALITALYVVITIVLAPFSFGAIQVRLSEGFNHLVVFNKRYVAAVTMGVFLSNLLASSFGWVDVIVGTLQTLITLLAMRWLNRHNSNLILKLVINTLVATFFMWIIALEVTLMSATTAFWPTFWMNWLTIGIGEFIAMAVGGAIIYSLSFFVDLYR